ncbi:hypothetical protein ABUS74_10750 [Vibrio cholerae]
MKELIYIYLSNGNGDIIMSTPALRLLESGSYIEYRIILKNPFQKEIIEHAGVNFPVFYFPDRSLRSVLRLIYDIVKNKTRFKSVKIVAPLMPVSRISKLFIKIAPCKFILNKSHGWQQGITLEGIESSHQVKEMLAFFARSRMIKLSGSCNETEYSFVKNNSGKNKNKMVAIGFTCGPAEKHKIPSEEYFAKIINFINELDKDYEYLVPFTKSESDWYEKLVCRVNDKNKLRPIIDKKFNELVNILSECKFGISGTTGLGHTFAYSGLPVVCLSGVADYRKSGPYTRDIYPIEIKLACSPCYVHNFSKGCGRMDCMDSIDFFEVKEIIKKLL